MRWNGPPDLVLAASYARLGAVAYDHRRTTTKRTMISRIRHAHTGAVPTPIPLLAGVFRVLKHLPPPPAEMKCEK